jgi:hypothetical protein
VAYYAVDRFEGSLAVLVADDGTSIDVSRRALPSGVREGSVIQVEIGSDGRPNWSKASLDEKERERRLKQARDALERLRKRDPGGDVTL